MIVENLNNFFILGHEDKDQYQNIFEILDFLKNILLEIFGEDISKKEPCIIFNDQEAKCPMLITNSDPVKIRLSLDKTSYWARMIYQLSHELCHYTIRSNKKEENKIGIRFEEILCEAFSLYILLVASERWQECELSKYDPSYRDNIMKYFSDEHKKADDHTIKSEMTFEQYKTENMDYRTDTNTDRESHIAERNHAYSLFRDFPDAIFEIVRYTEFMNDYNLVDFNRWIKDSSNKSFLNLLREVQPNLT